jgi:ribonuclease E
VSGSSSDEDPPTEQLVPTKRAVAVDGPTERTTGEVRRTSPTGVTGAVPSRVQTPAEPDPDTSHEAPPEPDVEAADAPDSPVMAGVTGISAARPARRRRRVASRPAGPPVGEDPV